MKTESIIQRLQEIEELRKQGNRFDLQNIEEDWTDLVDAQIDLERNTTTEIKELQVRETKMKSQTERKKDYLLNSELKTILEYIISGQTDRLQQSEWISVANKLLNKGGETLAVFQPPTDTNQVISSEIYET